VLLFSACLMEGAWAQFFFTGPGFLPDENGTNLDAPNLQQKPAPIKLSNECLGCPQMVVIPGGSFLMGTKPAFFGFDDYPNEIPLHQVKVPSFLMAKTEVTQGQWMVVMGGNPSRFGSCGANCPVENVSWDEVQYFIGQLNKLTGQKFRLPSEAEWEYAARAGTRGESSEDKDGSRLESVAWYSSNSQSSSREVAQKTPNNYGLFDMFGNVWEWVEDCWHTDYSGAPSDSTPWTSACASNSRVLRGGSWFDLPHNLRPTFRSKNDSSMRGGNIGFRLARDL